MIWENPSFNVFFTEKNTHTLVCQSWFTLTNVSFSSYCISCYTGWPKKRPISFFIPKSCFTFFFPYFSGGVDSRHGRLFWHQYGSNWTIYYAATDQNHRSVLCHKISSSDSGNAGEIWQGQCTWQKDSSKFGGQISGDRKCSRCPTKSTVVNIVQIVQIQQARVIFNPLTDIFTKWCLVLIYFDQLASARSEFCKEIA